MSPAKLKHTSLFM